MRLTNEMMKRHMEMMEDAIRGNDEVSKKYDEYLEVISNMNQSEICEFLIELLVEDDEENEND